MSETRNSQELFIEIYEWLENQVDAAMAVGDASRAILFATYMRQLESNGLVNVPSGVKVN